MVLSKKSRNPSLCGTFATDLSHVSVFAYPFCFSSHFKVWYVYSRTTGDSDLQTPPVLTTMASAGYTTATVNALMELVDENQASLKEHVYLQMCNALKDLHKSMDVRKSNDDWHRQRYAQLILENRALLARPHLFPRATVDRKMAVLEELSTEAYRTVHRSQRWTAKGAFVKALEEYVIVNLGQTQSSLNVLYKQYLDRLDATERRLLTGNIQEYETRLASLG